MSETNRNKVSPIVLRELEEEQLWEAIEKAMLDSEGKYNKGYFTFNELGVYRLTILSGGWTYLKLDQVIQQLLKQRKLEEIEPEKFRPTTTTKVECKEKGKTEVVSINNDGGLIHAREISIQKYKQTLMAIVKDALNYRLSNAKKVISHVWN